VWVGTPLQLQFLFQRQHTRKIAALSVGSKRAGSSTVRCRWLALIDGAVCAERKPVCGAEGHDASGGSTYEEKGW
jgi:hypothetical protein